MAFHELKTWPAFFEAVMSGSKTFEIRRDDRGFGVCDVLALREWDPAEQRYSGRALTVEVSYVLRNAVNFGLREGFAVLGLNVATVVVNADAALAARRST